MNILKKLIIASTIVSLVFVSVSCEKKSDKSSSSNVSESKIKLRNKRDSVSYSLGILIGANLKNYDLKEILNDQVFSKAVREVLNGTKEQLSPEAANMFLNTFFAQLQAKKSVEALEEGKKYLDENKKKAGVVTTASGLQYEVVKEGTGDKPVLNDSIVVHYKGTFMDGKEFDDSKKRGEPATFQLAENGLIKGWIEGLQLMKAGSVYKFTIPSDLGYGEMGRGPIKPNSVLVFEIELLSVKHNVAKGKK